MSDLQQALLISGGIFAVMVHSQYGTRESPGARSRSRCSPSQSRLRLPARRPIAMPDLFVYAAGASDDACAVGIAAAACTAIRRNANTGRILTVSGIGFVATWFVAMAVRIASSGASRSTHS